MSYEDRHDAEHGDRVGASTRYVEVCWRCAEEWFEYVRTHPGEAPTRRFVVMAIKPRGGSLVRGT